MLARMVRTIGSTIGVTLLGLIVSSIAHADSIEFSCQRVDVSDPTTVYYQVDLSASVVSTVSGLVQYRDVCPATITPASIDWQCGPQKHHLDRLSGHETLLVPNGNGDTLTIEFDCNKTTGF